MSAEHGVSRLGCLPVLAPAARLAGALPPALRRRLRHRRRRDGRRRSCRPSAPRPSSASPWPAAATSAAGRPPRRRRRAGASPPPRCRTSPSATSSRPTPCTTGMPEAMVTAQRIMPVVSAVGLLVAGGVVPVALLAYWVCNSAWTLGQSAAIARWFPTPGTAAPRAGDAARARGRGCPPCGRSRRCGGPRRSRPSGRVRSTTALSSPAAIRSSHQAKFSGSSEETPARTLPRARTSVGEAGHQRGPRRRRSPAAGDPSAGRGCRRCPPPRRTSRSGRATRCRAWSTTSVGAQRAHQVGVAVAAHAGDVGAGEVGELDGGGPDGARGAVDQHPLAGTDQVAQEVPGGAAAEEDRGGLLVVDAGRLGARAGPRVRRRARRARPSGPRSSRRPRRRRTPRSRPGPPPRPRRSRRPPGPRRRGPRSRGPAGRAPRSPGGSGTPGCGRRPS